MRRHPLAAIVLVLSFCGCSKMLGYDDVGFSPAAGAQGDASVPDSGGVDAGDEKDAAAETTPEDSAVAEGGPDAGEGGSDACQNVTCSGQGTCMIGDAGQPVCACNTGYHPDGVSCVLDETCTGVDCGRCGECELAGGKATCTCPSGFSHNGTGCVVDPDPCSPNPCDAEHVCVPEAHCQPLGACVPTCDCSNCGNCGGDNSDGRWDDWQEYCGNLMSSPATMACNKPCPAGEGCIPYNPPMCWPMEGCFSL